MAITKLPSGRYQVKVRGTDRSWITKAFDTKRDAEHHEAQLKQQKQGIGLTQTASRLTLDDYFESWKRVHEHDGTPAWRRQQRRLYEIHIKPILGQRTLRSITSPIIVTVLNSVSEKGLSDAMRLHVYVLLKQLFKDAINLFKLMPTNPVSEVPRPKLSQREARYLNLAQMTKLLEHVRSKPYGIAVWLGAFLGMRVGEVQALRWGDVDLDTGVVHIRRTYSKHDSVFREYPKGKKQHTKEIPPELLAFLTERRASAGSVTDDQLVIVPAGWKMLDYWDYLDVLQGYCREAGVPVISTHGLRHSTSELWMHHGATKDDLQRLFAHSSSTTTDRYIHGKGTNLGKVAKVIQLFPNGSTNVPREDEDQISDRLSN